MVRLQMLALWFVAGALTSYLSWKTTAEPTLERRIRIRHVREKDEKIEQELASHSAPSPFMPRRVER